MAEYRVIYPGVTGRQKDFVDEQEAYTCVRELYKLYPPGPYGEDMCSLFVRKTSTDYWREVPRRKWLGDADD